MINQEKYAKALSAEIEATKDNLQCANNTDVEIWRERRNDYYADSIHVTQGNGIGLNCGGYVIVRPIREWHKCKTQAEVDQLVSASVAASLQRAEKLADNDDIVDSDIIAEQIRRIPHDSTSLNRLLAEARLEVAKKWHALCANPYGNWDADAELAAEQKAVEDLK